MPYLWCGLFYQLDRVSSRPYGKHRGVKLALMRYRGCLSSGSGVQREGDWSEGPLLPGRWPGTTIPQEMGGGRRHYPTGSRSQISCGTDCHLLLSRIHVLQQRYHTPAGTGSPLVLQPEHRLTNSAICILFWLIAILDACLKSTN